MIDGVVCYRCCPHDTVLHACSAKWIALKLVQATQLPPLAMIEVIVATLVLAQSFAVCPCTPHL